MLVGASPNLNPVDGAKLNVDWPAVELEVVVVLLFGVPKVMAKIDTIKSQNDCKTYQLLSLFHGS